MTTTAISAKRLCHYEPDPESSLKQQQINYLYKHSLLLCSRSRIGVRDDEGGNI